MKKKENTDAQHNDDISKLLGMDSPKKSAGRLKRRIILILAVLLIAFVTFKWSKNNGSQNVSYKTQTVQRGDITITVNATGTLEPTNQVDVGSELSGIIKTVAVDYNDRVKVGQALARLDTAKLEAAVLQYKAALESANAKVMQAKATVTETGSKLSQLQRAWQLSNKKVPSQSDLDAGEAAFERAKADEASARAAVSQARATLEANQTDLSKAVIRSPINGIVLTRSVDPGQTVAASLQAPVLFTLAEDLTQMELHVDVDEADVSQVKKGQGATFTVDAYPDQTFPALISQVRYGATTTDGVVTYETVLKVDNSEILLRPGMTATADITVKKIENAILLPNAALRFTPPVTESENSEDELSGSGGIVSKLLPRPPHPKSSSNQIASQKSNRKEQKVWMINDSRLVSVSVTIGATDGTMTQVVSGDLEPGTVLVVDTINISK
ncbi:MAG: efflux RND transporter periplasmic adaptor subunit [Proteobacteria bacterium]|nr:efflux RND transporter periplasmic adaptor subunit [Pseudomonadota bacterium]